MRGDGASSVGSTRSRARLASVKQVDSLNSCLLRGRDKVESKGHMKYIKKNLLDDLEMQKAVRQFIQLRREGKKQRRKVKVCLDRRQRRFVDLNGTEMADTLMLAEPCLRRTWLLSLDDKQNTKLGNLLTWPIKATALQKHGFHGKPLDDFKNWYVSQYVACGSLLSGINQDGRDANWTTEIGDYMMLVNSDGSCTHFQDRFTKMRCLLPNNLVLKESELCTVFELQDNHDRKLAKLVNIHEGNEMPLFNRMQKKGFEVANAEGAPKSGGSAGSAGRSKKREIQALLDRKADGETTVQTKRSKSPERSHAEDSSSSVAVQKPPCEQNESRGSHDADEAPDWRRDSTGTDDDDDADEVLPPAPEED